MVNRRSQELPRIYRPRVAKREPLAVSRLYTFIGSGGGTRVTLLTPTAGYNIRFVRAEFTLVADESSVFNFELYFGLGIDIIGPNDKAIDSFLNLQNVGEKGITRTYDALSTARAPTGLRDEVISGRIAGSVVNEHQITIEFIEETGPRRPRSR